MLPSYITAFRELTLRRELRGGFRSLQGVTQGAMEACPRELSWSRQTCTCPWWRDRIGGVRRVTRRSGKDGHSRRRKEHVWWAGVSCGGCCLSGSTTKYTEHGGGGMREEAGPWGRHRGQRIQGWELRARGSPCEEFIRQEKDGQIRISESPLQQGGNRFAEEWVSLSALKALSLTLLPSQPSLLVLPSSN